MKEIKVGILGSLDMLEFKKMKEKRNTVIDNASPEEIIGEYSINKHAKEMHPDYQELIVKKVIEHKNAKSYILSSENNKLAYFKAGQSLSLKLQIGNSLVTRSYSISSSPKQVSEGNYRITVKRKQNGFVSDYILNTFTEGTKVITSAPYGNLYYEKFRDKQNVIAIAGGSGITPFLSMAHAIQDGIEDFNLTILYGNNTYDSILFKEELDSITKNCDKVKVIYVLANEEKEGCEKGYITSDLIKKYSNSPYSIFVCGPSKMHKHIEKETMLMNKPRKDIRYETLSNDEALEDTQLSKDVIGKTFKIKVIQGPNTYTIDAKSNETLLVALERAGIKAPSKCRGGECGWCRSKLLLGSVYSNIKKDQRRYIDKEYNYIHPCSVYPTQDCVIEVAFEYY